MIPTLKPYSQMKDSGTDWFGEIPEHWDVRRLRTVSEMRVSNVDKHSKEGEAPVRLCNYVDVYYHDRIRPEMTFLKATATPAEIQRFRLQRHDVLITKDSEAWDDIGVPSLVENGDSDLLSGYHLALLRPRLHLIAGGYLFRALQSVDVAGQLHVSANGVTRYGLSHPGIKATLVPLPPTAEQTAIARFLDHMDRRIQKYIRAKEKLIALLDEYKQALIHQAVTGQIDVRTGEAYPEYKESGVEWLGTVPRHWDVRPGKWHLREADDRSETGSEELLSVSHITGVTPRKQKNVTMFKAESNIGHKLCKAGDIVVNTMWAWMAALGVAREAGLVSPSYAVYRPYRSALSGSFTDLLLRTRPYKSEYICRSTGIRASRLRLYPEYFLSIKLICPPLEEQRAIVAFLDSKSAAIHRVADISLSEIEALREYRNRLIADAVTGRIDVREVAVSDLS